MCYFYFKAFYGLKTTGHFFYYLLLYSSDINIFVGNKVLVLTQTSHQGITIACAFPNKQTQVEIGSGYSIYRAVGFIFKSVRTVGELVGIVFRAVHRTYRAVGAICGLVDGMYKLVRKVYRAVRKT